MGYASALGRTERSQTKAESNGRYGHVGTQSPKSTSSYEERLWDRQDAMWDREMKRWDAERALWTVREERLQQQIANLQALVIELAMQSKAAPQGTSSLQTALSSAPQHPQAASVPPQADVQRQSAAAFPTSPSGSVSSASAPAQAYTAPSAESPESTQAPEQLAADLMQPSLNPTEATDPLPEEGAPAHAGPSPGDTIFDLAEFQALYDRKAEEVGGSADFAADLANAIAAVDLTDVMEDENPFRRVEQQGLRASSIDLGEQPRSLFGDTAAEDDNCVPEPEAPAAGAAGAPVLVPGCDDIYWMNHLHSALSSKGYFPGDEEMESWLFADQTQSALLTFQAVAGIPETGVCDSATWEALLGAEALQEALQEAAQLGVLDDGANYSAGSAPAAKPLVSSAPAAPSTSSSFAAAEAPISAPYSSDEELKDWPILREGEGGKLVHHLQVVLNQHGYYCGEDETVWWQFGSDTYSSLLTFQACKGLPETGVADVGTWKTLMKDGAEPSDVLSLQSEDDTDDDMQASDGKIWLLGEQRWAKLG
ncbi:g6139 [Coccomyxa viridis]|uniref:G6139 protein n=1 Tax=Coccomyxa viridis TaxID=1274662 RepID=A0ABP1FUN0_9CHLO